MVLRCFGSWDEAGPNLDPMEIYHRDKESLSRMLGNWQTTRSEFHGNRQVNRLKTMGVEIHYQETIGNWL